MKFIHVIKLLLINIFVETKIYFLLFYENNVQTNSIYLKYKYVLKHYKCFYCHFWSI